MHDDHGPEEAHPDDETIDEAEDESFPASDPQSSWAGPDVAPPDGDVDRARKDHG